MAARQAAGFGLVLRVAGCTAPVGVDSQGSQVGRAVDIAAADRVVVETVAAEAVPAAAGKLPRVHSPGANLPAVQSLSHYSEAVAVLTGCGCEILKISLVAVVADRSWPVAQLAQPVPWPPLTWRRTEVSVCIP